jgi:hypothetical protein
VAKLYLPAWSGAGLSYDDEEPPPRETLVVAPPRRDSATGATFAQIGEWSRACHRSQGMGVWKEVGRTSWPLHLLLQAEQAPGPEREIQEGVPYDLRALAALPGLPSRVGRPLEAAQHAIDAAIAAFPDGAAIAASALNAARSLDAAREACPPEWAPQIGHRLDRKARELDLVLFEAHGVVARASARPSRLAPGHTGAIEIFIEAHRVPVEVDIVSSGAIVPSGRTSSSGLTILDIAAAPAAHPSNPYPPTFDPLGGNGEAAVRLTIDLGGRQATRLLDIEEPLLVLPDTSVHLDPDAVIVNLARPRGEIRVGLSLETQEGAEPGALSFDPPEGWMVATEGDGIRLTPPTGLKPSCIVLRPKLSGQPAYRITPIRSAPGGSGYFHRALDLPILAVDARLPDGTRIGYVGGGNDRVDTWLARLGLDVVELDPERLTRGDLSGLTTIVAGIFAFGTRPDLRASAGRLRSWVENGGHLVTFYHRPSDGWDPETVPPRRLKIGLPSLRWRVTDPNAPVHVLAPDHPLIRRPNVIGPDDWAGWDKERGLYFASEWDEAYVPLLAISDPGENPLHGGLVSGVIGRGRHTHTSLVLDHQLEKLVPGAFRLLANLVQPA